MTGGMSVSARPRSLFAFTFDCYDEDERILASFHHRALRSNGLIGVDAVEYVVARAGTGFIVREPGSESANVTILPEGRGQISVRWDGRSLTVARAGIGFKMVLMSEGGQIGTLGLRDLLGRTMTLDCDGDLPPLVLGSLFWLAVARRRQLLMV